MKFTQLTLASNLLAELGLPDVPYEGPTVYVEHVGRDPACPPLIAMLFALQQRMAGGGADWLKLAPIADALVQCLDRQGWPDVDLHERLDFTVQLDEIDLDGNVIAIQRQDRILAVLAEAAGGRVRAQLFQPPCARTIEILIGFSRNADERGALPYYGTAWNSAEDTAAGNGQFYAAQAGQAYLAPWSFGLGIGWDKRPSQEWMMARRHLQPWPEDARLGLAVINAYAAMRDLIDSLPSEEWQEETLPAFYALPPQIEPELQTASILPLNAHNLSQPDGRFAFLWSIYADYQEDGLLMAVNHVWNCLDKPRSLRCALMAQRVGKTGTGRKALLRFLSRFLAETLYEFDVPDLPDRDAYPSSEAWSADCLAHFERLEARMTEIISRYEAILDGRDPQDVKVPTGIVIKGPWRPILR